MLFDEVEPDTRRIPIGHTCLVVQIGDSEVTFADDIHPDQNTRSTCEYSLGHREPVKLDILHQHDVDQVLLCGRFPGYSMDLCHAHGNQPKLIYNFLRYDRCGCTSIPNRAELDRLRKWIRRGFRIVPDRNKAIGVNDVDSSRVTNG